jgi:hypothetical protein
MARMQAGLHVTPNQIIHERGVEYEPRFAKCRKMAARQCFRNAWLMSTNRPGLTYVEGWATSTLGVPVEHAWCVDSEGTIYDPTWYGKDRPKGTQYFGVPLHRDAVTSVLLETRFYGVFCQFNWLKILPILKEHLPNLSAAA